MTDIEIQNSYKMQSIVKVAKKFGLSKKNLIAYGDYRAKLLGVNKRKNGKLILVTATNPTKFGEGKTTVSVGLNDALNMLGKKSVLALREPSLGPVFGVKGGATGGGYSQIVPMEDINLHFNGDFHAITSANNLLCSLIDNSLYFGNPLNIDKETINFHRCLDINDRALRDIQLNIEGKVERKEKFNITAASEIMGIMTLAQNIEDLKQRIGNILIGFNHKKQPIFAKQLHCEDAIVILLKDALKPNIVQTLQGNLAIVHTGPFANISHGCNSVVATKTALKIGDYCVTEAGFGADLGAQKFLDFVCPVGEFFPSATVLVTTLRSIKYNGGVEESLIDVPNQQAIIDGIKIVLHHINNLTKIYNQNVVVAINRFPTDTDEELDFVKNIISQKGFAVTVCEPYVKGGAGCIELAKLIEKNKDEKVLKSVYKSQDAVETKIEKIVKKIFGASNVIFSPIAEKKLKLIKQNGFDKLPVIIAKTQYSLTDDPKKIGVVKNFDFTITDLEINSGAGYIVAVAGKMMLMPGLSKMPNAINMTIDNSENIAGLF